MTQSDDNRSVFPAPEVSFRDKILKAGVWSLAGFGVSLTIRFGSNLLMTRLLMPEMFGIMAMASTVLVGLSMFSDVGIKQNIVHSVHGASPSFLNTAWSIQILRGLLLWSLAVIASLIIFFVGHAGQFPANSVYAAPSLPYVMIALSFSAVIAGFESTKVFEASRNLSLGRVTNIEVVSQIIGLLSMIVWVIFDRTIWALVAGSLTSSFAKTVLSHIWLLGNDNKWEWHDDASQEIIHFGKWIFISSILGFLVNSGDRLLLGGLVNSATLGFYVIASLLAGAVEGILSRIMSDVSFPALSQIFRERPDHLKRNYYKFFSIIAPIAYFSSGFLFFSGPTLVKLLYDARYESAGSILQFLAIVLLTIPFRLSVESLLAMGKPRLQSNIILARFLVLFCFTPIGFHFFGFNGALVAIVLSHFSSLPMVLFYNVRHKLFDLRMEILLLLFSLVGAGTGLLVTFTVSHWM